MIVTLIYLVLSLLAIHEYFKSNYRQFIIITAVLIFKGFGLIPFILGTFGNPNVYNFLVIEIIGIIAIGVLQKKDVIRIKRDRIGTIIFALLAYQLLVVIYSGLTGVDSWTNVLGQYRFCLLPLLYFILKPINVETYISLYPCAKFVTCITVVSYILFSLLFASEEGNPFKQIVVGLAPSMLFCMLFEKDAYLSSKHKKTVISLLCLGIFLLMARMFMLAIIASIAYYVVIVNKNRKLIFPLLLLIIISPLIMHFMDSAKGRSSNSNDLKTELAIIRESGDYSDYSSSSGALRFISILERFDYMKERPFNMLFGIGAMKEVTAQQKMSFVSGTHGTLEENGRVVVLQIDTDDVGLLSKYMRYGLCYLLLFSIWLRRSLKQYKNLIGRPFMKTGFLLSMMMLLAIPGSDLFFYETSMFLFLVFMAISTNYKNIPYKTNL